MSSHATDLSVYAKSSSPVKTARVSIIQHSTEQFW